MALSPREFFEQLISRDLSFFAGVPDSLLKELCAYITASVPASDHVITVNEGAAVGLVTGYHLATGKAGVVYMQNSGTGNAINPLLSLADPDVYAVPMLVIIGWRGEPGVKDEPQHVKQGRVQQKLLASLEYPFEVLDPDPAAVAGQLDRLVAEMHRTSGPVVLLVRAESFESYSAPKTTSELPLGREEALQIIVERSGPEDLFASTTGKVSRELFEIREARGEGHGKDFLTVGSMGHTSMIALGLAARTEKPVYCIDGDGAALMHLGSLGIIGANPRPNFRHIVMNNGVHDSVGGQPTIGRAVRFATLATELGYTASYLATTADELLSALAEVAKRPGPSLIEVRVRPGARSDLGRPTTTPRENKAAFMASVGIDPDTR
ncbi:MAG: phosphonopyruvate decarboxylase [Spirochaetaceae bacterium]|nr:MAG: phosphonopyruvate decarboxylase [Spirochaetaceae bacterium]